MKITEHEMRGLLTGKCIAGDMRVNEELAAYLVRKFSEQQKKLDAAEAKLAELEKQEPVLFRDSQGCFVSKGKGEQLIKSGEFVTPYYLRPAPAINLAELVPPEKNPAFIAYVHLDETTADKPEAYAKGFNACRAAILRNIEEKSK